jgi:hypothetical protein
VIVWFGGDCESGKSSQKMGSPALSLVRPRPTPCSARHLGHQTGSTWIHQRISPPLVTWVMTGGRDSFDLRGVRNDPRVRRDHAAPRLVGVN